MNARWQQYAKRIDAMSLRERAFLFLSAALVLAALADSLVLTPALVEQQTLSTKLKQQSDQLKAMRAQLAAATQPAALDTPEGRLQAAVVQARAKQVTLDAEIHRRLSSTDEMAKLPDLLERALRRHERLTLVKLATLSEPPTAAGGAINNSANGSANGITTLSTGLRWQGVDLSVSGNYLDLMNYLAELEQALPGLRWGELSIAAAAAPPVLTVRLYLVGEAP